jgi:Ca-activated chloride channel family protein
MHAAFLWLLFPLVIYLYKREKKQVFSQNLRWAVLALIIVALARPVLPQTLGFEKIETHSLMIALDLSVSMNADDIKPSRLIASKKSIKKFLELNNHEQIALIGFTINPLLLSPPTTDHELLVMALKNINSEYILTKGTNLKKLFEKVAQFKDEEKKVILFSDGGDEVLDEELIHFVQKEKIKTLVIAMATKQGTSLKQKDGRLIADKEGHIIVSKLNISLKTLAMQSGGEFIVFSSVENTVSSIKNWLAKENFLKEGLEREARHYFELAFIPLFLALILFFISATRFSKNLLAIFLFLGMNVQAEELVSREDWGEGIEPLKVEALAWGISDVYYLHRAYNQYENSRYKQSQRSLYKIKNRNLEAEILLAHIFYKQEKYKAAKSVFKGIKSLSKKVKQQVYYELGNCEAKMLYMDKAKNYYVKALQLGEDEDALHNLNVVILREKGNAFNVGYINPSSAEVSKAKSDKVEVSKENTHSQKNESAGASGGTGSKKSKNSTVKVLKVEQENNAKRVLSSKAYDLINEGYIREEKPW